MNNQEVLDQRSHAIFGMAPGLGVNVLNALWVDIDKEKRTIAVVFGGCIDEQFSFSFEDENDFDAIYREYEKYLVFDFSRLQNDNDPRILFISLKRTLFTRSEDYKEGGRVTHYFDNGDRHTLYLGTTPDPEDVE